MVGKFITADLEWYHYPVSCVVLKRHIFFGRDTAFLFIHREPADFCIIDYKGYQCTMAAYKSQCMKKSYTEFPFKS